VGGIALPAVVGENQQLLDGFGRYDELEARARGQQCLLEDSLLYATKHGARWIAERIQTTGSGLSRKPELRTQERRHRRSQIAEANLFDARASAGSCIQDKDVGLAAPAEDAKERRGRAILVLEQGPVPQGHVLEKRLS